MTAAVATPQSLDLVEIAARFAPGDFRIDPFGVVSGYKAYMIYTGLAGKSDAELSAMGLTRADLPRTAVEAAKVLQAA